MPPIILSIFLLAILVIHFVFNKNPLPSVKKTGIKIAKNQVRTPDWIVPDGIITVFVLVVCLAWTSKTGIRMR